MRKIFIILFILFSFSIASAADYVLGPTGKKLELDSDDFTVSNNVLSLDAGLGLHDAITLDANADTFLGLTDQEVGLDTQTANTIFSGPTSGSAAVPTFRALVPSDIPLIVIITYGDCDGTHDGGNNVAILADSSQSWTLSQYVGGIIYNITDGSSGTISANDATTITATLAGGTDNDWDTGDTYIIGPSLTQMRGSLIKMTAATTTRLPAVTATTGYSGCFYIAGNVAVNVDPNASDKIELEGIVLDDGDKILSSGTRGDFVFLVNDSTDGWTTLGLKGTWIDNS